MEINVEAQEVVKKKVALAGSIGRVYLPREWVGRKVIVILPEERGKNG